MATLGEVVRRAEEQLFVGREAELAMFREWLAQVQGVPQILNVSGPGGTGKSTLLRAFQRIASTIGRPVLLVDGRDFSPSPEGLLAILGSALRVRGSADSSVPDLEIVIAALNKLRPVLLLDTFELLADLTGYLRDIFLPRLDPDVRLVIAGRYPLGLSWSGHDAWSRLIRPLPLGSLRVEESRTYLSRRGIIEGRATDEILGAAGGHPLALALAADLVVQHGVRRFATAPEWRLAVRALVERLLEGLDDRLRTLLEAGAVVRQFNEGTLVDLVGPEIAENAFDRLYQLSFVRPSYEGLMLHDDVRRILAEDLRWRHPERHRELRLSALAHYRRRMQMATPATREQLITEQLFLWEDAFARGLLFADVEPGQVWLEPGRSADHVDVLRIWSFWIEHFLAAEMPLWFDRKADQVFLESILHYRARRLRIARDPDGQAVGFALGVPVCRESLAILDTYPTIGQLAHVYLDRVGPARLPTTPESSTLFYHVYVAHTDVQPEAVRAALARDVLSLLARGETYLACSPIPSYKQLLEMMGWQLLPAARNWHWSDEFPSDGYVLDLRRIGVEHWIESLISGTAPVLAQQAGAERHPAAALGGGKDLLTRREQEVAALIARGLSNRQIAEILVIAEGTAERHVANILSKLGFTSRTQIATWAVERGLSAAAPPV